MIRSNNTMLHTAILSLGVTAMPFAYVSAADNTILLATETSNNDNDQAKIIDEHLVIKNFD